MSKYPMWNAKKWVGEAHRVYQTDGSSHHVNYPSDQHLEEIIAAVQTESIIEGRRQMANAVCQALWEATDIYSSDDAISVVRTINLEQNRLSMKR